MFSARNAFMAGVAKLVDLFWPSVTSSIKTIGVSGATNNAFRDDGPSNLLPTRFGDVTQGTLSPYGPPIGTAPPQIGGAVFFDGTGDYLQITPTANTLVGTSDFCYEFWHYKPMSGGAGFWVSGDNPGASFHGVTVGYSGTQYWYLLGSNGSWSTQRYAGTVPINTWTHVAITRQSNTMRFFVNGAQIDTWTDNYSISNPTYMRVGGGDGYMTTGSLSNVRLVIGSAVYTAAFTPPTAPLTAISGTSLLTCQSSTAITDASSNAFAVIKYGDARAVVDTPFGYGSAYFDGGTTYLSVADNTALRMGTGDFTIEMWWYPTAVGGYQTLVEKGYVSTGGFVLQTQGAAFNLYLNGSGLTMTGSVLSSNCWHHIAIVRSGGTVTLYVNGVSATSGTNASDLNATTALGIGSSTNPYNQGYYPSTGYISNVRVVKGTAVYSGSTFTPPTAPLTAISNTVLLTAQDKAVVADASSNAFTVTKVGTAKPTDWTPFALKSSGQWSAYFDGSGDMITVAANTARNVGTSGNFTVEGWFYLTTYTYSSYWNVLWQSTDYYGLKVMLDGSGYLRFSLGDTHYVTATTLTPLNQWIHVAVVRNNGTVTLYLNGTSLGSAANNTAATSSMAGAIIIGTMSNSGGWITGYVSNFRMTTTAVYTSAFTPPTSSLTAIPGTTTLVLQDNRFRDASPYNLAVTRTGDVAISRFNPFGNAVVATTNFSTGSITTDNAASSYLTVPASSNWVFGGDYTIEAWVMPRTTNLMVVWATGGLGSADQFTIAPSSTNTATDGYCFWSYGVDGGQIASSINMPIGRWSHVALSRVGSTLRMFVNGIVVATKTGATTTIGRYGTGYIGARSNFEYPLFGNISNLRIVNGTGLYTTNFTPSTSPLTAVANTVLLTCQDSTTVTDASPNNYTVTRVGTTYITEASPFKRVTYPYGGSAYFDGSGDYLDLGKSTTVKPGSGDFTLEMWLYKNVDLAWMTPCGDYSPSTNTFTVFFDSTGKKVGWANGSNQSLAITGATDIPAMTWTHVAFVRSSGTIKLYVNGVLDGSASVSTDYSNTTYPLLIGNDPQNISRWFNGYISGFRLVKGVAVYTANFTPPVAPVDAVGGTSLLLNFDNAAIYDSTGDRNILVNGTTTQTSAAVTKFGTERTMYFSGAYSSCVSIPDSVDLRFGTGDFTIECWFYTPSLNLMVLWYRGGGTTGTTQAVVLNSSYTGNLQYNGGSTIVGGTYTNGVWNHVAVSRTSGSTKMFLNGTQIGSTLADTTDYNLATPLTIGDRYPSHPYGNYPFTGYISDFRVTKGIGRYTSNFSVPTASFPTSST